MTTKQQKSLMNLKPELTVKATITGIQVFAVDRTWHFQLMQFLANPEKGSQFPKSCWPLNDVLVMKADSGRSFVYEIDFQVIPKSVLYRFAGIFGPAPLKLIEGNLVLSPTGRPTFLRLGTEIRLTISLPRGSEIRMCDPNWLVSDIERDACNRHQLVNHRLFFLGGREPIQSSMKAKELQSQGEYGVSLKPINTAVNPLSTSSFSAGKRIESPRGGSHVTTEGSKVSSSPDWTKALGASSSLSPEPPALHHGARYTSIGSDSYRQRSTDGVGSDVTVPTTQVFSGYGQSFQTGSTTGKGSTDRFGSGVTVPPTQVSPNYGQSFQTDSPTGHRSRDRSGSFKDPQPKPVSSRYGSSFDQDFDDYPSISSTRFSDEHRGRTVGPVGLQNLGNTCFMNAPLQCLMRVKSLTDYLLSGRCQADRNPHNPIGSRCQILDSYCALLREVSNGRSPVSPTALKRAISCRNSVFAGYNQHDANEFLTTLLDALHEDLNQSRTAKGHHLDLDRLSGMELHRTCNQSIIVDLFHGETSTKFTFSCGTYQNIDEPLASWILPLPSGEHRTSLANCIRLWGQEQVMTGDNGLWCDRCHRTETARKKATVVRFPRVLIIQLKRFTVNYGRLSKNSAPVSYPLQFNHPGGTYHLTGVVHHSGTLSGGHYTCLVRDSPTSSQWYEISDSYVSPVRSDWGSEITDSSAMTLFYQQ